MFGYSVRYDVAGIQKLIGSVPQHDLLWNELSAYEHIRLFADMKGLASSEEAIHHILDDVHLLQECHQAAGGYSGGMKRRLSIALAGVGDPKILVMGT